MKIQFCYTGQLASAAGVVEETIELPDKATVLVALTERIDAHGGKFAELLADDSGAPRSTLLVALNDEQVASDAYDSTPLADGNSLMLMTPIAGG
jgi:molybdopterin converting factor small subunit